MLQCHDCGNQCSHLLMQALQAWECECQVQILLVGLGMRVQGFGEMKGLLIWLIATVVGWPLPDPWLG